MGKFAYRIIISFILIGTVVKSEYAIKNGYLYYNFKESNSEYKMTEADIKTLKILDDNYAIDGKHVFFQKDIIEKADLKTFEILEDSYSKDRKNVYYREHKISGANSETFEILDDSYSKDRKNVYFMYDILKGADPKSFRRIPETDFYRDKNNIFYSSEKVGSIKGENIKRINQNLIKNDGSLFMTFWKYDKFKNKKIEIITRNDSSLSYYIKDGKNIYYLARSMEKEVDGKLLKLKEIDYATFDFIDKEFSTYIKDKNGIYYVSRGGANKINADRDTFKIINVIFSKDKNNVFYDNVNLDIHSEEFEILAYVWDSTYYLRDKNNVYYLDAYIGPPTVKIVKGADVKSFTVIDNLYSKDRNNIFCNAEILKGADIKTFEIASDDGEITAKDSKNKYDRNCKIIK